MCRYMAAQHQPCKHLHLWFARCYWARMFEKPHCQFEHFITEEYPEYYRCPDCRAMTKAELKRGIGKWKIEGDDDEKTNAA